MKNGWLAKIASTPRAMELFIGYMLRVGVILSGTICIVGGTLYLVRYGGTQVDFTEFQGSLQSYRSFSGIWQGLCAWDPLAFVQTGVALLLATPILRVVFSVFAFLFERDYLYVTITGIVLAVILLNMTAK